MNDFFIKNKDKRLDTIPLAGTHDAAAYQLVNGYNDSQILRLLNFLRRFPCVNKIAKDWTLTQSLDIVQQAELGVQLFDLRVMYDVKQKKFFFAHTLLCIEADKLLNQLKAYIDEHPEYYCVFTARADSRNSQTLTPERSAEFAQMVKSIFGNRLITKKTPNPYKPGSYLFPTLRESLENGENVLFLYKEESPEYPWLWSFDYVDTLWFTTEDYEELYQQIKKFIEDNPYYQDDPKFRYLSLTMSPLPPTIVGDVLKRIFIPGYEPKNIYSLSYHVQFFLERLNKEGVDLSGMSGWLFDFPIKLTIEEANK